MQIKDKVVVVTGGANGIGKAMCQRFMQEKARAVVVADIDEQKVSEVAAELSCFGIQADVTVESDIIRIVEKTQKEIGPIDLFCSNAGIISSDAPGWTAASSDNAVWKKSWEVHVMAHVYAARAVLPGMIKRGKGYLLNTSSAAGLLSQIGSAPYSVTKHAAIGFAESLAITHKNDGIKVSVLCPQAVRTRMIAGNEDGSASVDGIMEPDEVAECVIQGLARETFLILPHPDVKTYYQRKASDYDRWLSGMARLKETMLPYMMEQQKKDI
ncbi:MAG: SDR family oxidoreductase [Proteobacteria bacterium]|nr:SDR family oxidoreductase [Pseudomonadota bacterium]MBU1387243.1 SDR family oxidoreductase [Pseudomonadota bacterium]MBU1544903.1 SDR family oxidoreductase [Pseudomonadota bacterium]MBU2429796.1 SDR family oxidoreductase [Pseudomonadota bacterium]MBU2482518.1 SDR family oxidoreductase [Pseudomonadota bacterium]